MDVVARAWSRGFYARGSDADPRTHRALKTVHPTYVDGNEAVSWLWHLNDELPTEAHVIARLARRVFVLGWGSDFVIAGGRIADEEETATSPIARWRPQRNGESEGLRVPVAGSLDDLVRRHAHVLSRLESDRFEPPPPLTVYATVSYQPEATRIPPPSVGFTLLQPTGQGFRLFHTSRQALSVSGMTRHVVKLTARRAGWDDLRIDRIVLGHGERQGDVHRPVETGRLAYVPVPTIERRQEGEVVGGVRRVMVTMLGDASAGEIIWARRALTGQPLLWEREGSQAALLGTLPAGDAVTSRYLRTASTWSTVTPVILPGYDDPGHYRRRLAQPVNGTTQKDLLGKLALRIDRLIRKAIVQAGFPKELADHAGLEWRRVGFLSGTEPADRYGVPTHLKRFTPLHVRVSWRDSAGLPINIAGPCIIGAGRFYGLGLFASG
jgi:CRISPR-associated protein Csb2